jgi:hypothetical protein
MSEIILYENSEGKVKVEVRFENETFWLSQKSMAGLFGCSTDNISLHLKRIFSEGELAANSVAEDYSATAADGKNYKTKFYNLDAIIAVGYRVNSKQATQFRIWATTTLKEFIIKGFVLDDERLKQGKQFGKDYFDELLARIRDIRASEKRFYQKIRDLFALSKDYDKTDRKTDQFFANIQNKLLFAVTQQTAAELIVNRAKADSPNMGLTTWKGSRLRKEDVIIAKNYLSEDEIDTLNRLVTLFLDSAELRVKEHSELTLDFWKNEADHVIAFSRKPILENTGQIGQEQMKIIAFNEFDKFDAQRKKTDAEFADKEDQKLIENLIKKSKRN